HQHLHGVRHGNLDTLERRLLDGAGQQVELLARQIFGQLRGDLNGRDFLYYLTKNLVNTVRLGTHQGLIVAEQRAYGDQTVDGLRPGLLPLALRAEGHVYDLTHDCLSQSLPARGATQVPCRVTGCRTRRMPMAFSRLVALRSSGFPRRHNVR